MKNKKILSLLLAVTMLVALVIPVQAAEATETTTLLTMNAVKDNSMLSGDIIGKVSQVTEKTVVEYDNPYNLTVQRVNYDVGFAERHDAAGFFDGQLARDNYSLYNGQDETYSLTIDLGAVQSVEDVVFFETANVNSLKVALTDTLWETYKDSFSIASYVVSTSTDNVAWTDSATITPATATADTTFYQLLADESVDRVFHSHHYALAEPTEARYIKLTCKEKGYSFTVSEIAVLGDALATKGNATLLTGNATIESVRTYVENAMGKTASMPYNPAIGNSYMSLSNYQHATYSSGDVTSWFQNGNAKERKTDSGWVNGTAELLIDLGAVSTVEDIFAWNCAKDYFTPDWTDKDYPLIADYENGTKPETNQIHTFSKITVYTSETGEDDDWSAGEAFVMGERTADEVSIGTIRPNGLNYQHVYHSYHCQLATPVNARYVKLAIDYKLQLGMGEVMVFGQPGTAKPDRQIVSGNATDAIAPGNTQKIPLAYANSGYNAVLFENSDSTVAWANSSYAANGLPRVYDSIIGGDIMNGTAAWGEGNLYTSTTIHNLGKKMVVSGVDAFVSRGKSVTRSGFTKIKVEASKDGETYATVVPETAITPNLYLEKSDGKLLSNFANFEPVEAQYVRVTITGDQKQIQANEIAIVGKPFTTATAPKFYDAGGNDWDGDNSFQDVLGSVKTTVSDGTGTLVVAWYNDAEDVKEALLKKVWVATGSGEVSVNISESESEEIISSIAANTGALKAFVFKNVQDASLIAGAVSLTLGE